jgi:hypothetical protein
MDREEAFRTLSLHESADGQMVQTAYWALVRRAQEDGLNNPKARYKIEAYNEAYQTLAPDARHFEPPPMKISAVVRPSNSELIDRAADWLSAEGRRTRERWANRLPEIAVLGVVTLFLMVLALGAGAPFLLVVLAWLVAIAVIWAPWREPKIDLGSREERDPHADASPVAANREELAS